MTIEWKNPPEPTPRKGDVVAAQLRAKPGEWALIEENTEQYFFCWWDSLSTDPDYEMKTVKKDAALFGRRDIYARFRIARRD